jgi:predicted nucleic acid-binding protein
VAEIFVDTSGWFALVIASAPEHAKAVAELEARIRRGVRVVTTNLVLAESHALLMRRAGRKVALEFLREVRRPPNVVVTSDDAVEGKALDDWLSRYSDQEFSFTDAVSFAVMRQRRIREALALDQHFSTAGFEVVPAA